MLNEIGIRDINTEDYTILTYLIGECSYAETPEKVFDRLNKITIDTNYKTLVAEINGKVVGFIGLCKLYAYEESGCYVRVIDLVVDKQYRNYGIGTKLINSAEKWASSEGSFALY